MLSLLALIQSSSMPQSLQGLGRWPLRVLCACGGWQVCMCTFVSAAVKSVATEARWHGVQLPSLGTMKLADMPCWLYRYNWHSVPQQLDSVRKIQGLDFKHLLPGHGRPGSFKTAADKDALFQELLDRES